MTKTKEISVTKRRSGGCLCGYIRFEARGHASKPHTCSCGVCRKHSGALTVAWIEYDRSSVSWTGKGGPPSLYRSSDASSRAFCPKCGSTLGAIDNKPTVALLVASFDSFKGDDLVSTSHSYVTGLPSWWHVEAGGRPFRTKRT